ncbi:MAG TPA: TetR/AcrR family transcriptional regulator [Chryseolinea sp.]|nr:TetR/AcrR family transcriptional regulator [Chryseolinea sp.]
MEDVDIRKKIIRGAENLFTKYGVRSISMDDIARHLSVSKKTLYQHFEDKEDIVTTAVQSHIERIMGEFDAIQSAAIDAIDELSKISQCLKRTMSEINPSLMFDLEKYHPRAWNVWVESKKKFIRESVISNLKRGVEQGYFRPELDLEIMATMRMELVQLAFDDRIFPTSHFKIAEVQLQIFDHFVFGLLTEKGRKKYLKCKETQIELSNS